jgi:hypothetical protein
MSSKASLTGLPTEIRQKIFRHVIHPEEISEAELENRWLTENLGDLVAIHYSEHMPPRLIKGSRGTYGHQLLRVSRTCYLEAAPMWYDREGFYLFNDYDWSMWWRIQPFINLPSFELHHSTHPRPYGFKFIRELAFQPTPEISDDFVRAIESSFPNLRTLRAFRHVFVHDTGARLTGELPDVWREFHRFVLSAAAIVTSNHSTLKYAKWSDRRCFPDKKAKDSIRTMTVKLTADDVLTENEVCWNLPQTFPTHTKCA